MPGFFSSSAFEIWIIVGDAEVVCKIDSCRPLTHYPQEVNAPPTSELLEMIRALPDWPRPRRVGREEQLAVAAAGARVLYGRGAHRVWLFGSIARGKKLGVHSDFDFATEGLPPESYLNCLGTLLQLMPLPANLVEMESASKIFRERILEEGILLPDAR